MHQLVPLFILQKFARDDMRGAAPVAALFADLSGFSIMSDTLGRYGYPGSEVEAAVMQAVFDPLVESVYTRGGCVVGYAGDATTAIFFEDDSGVPAAQRCLDAAVAIQSHFASHALQETPFGKFTISVKIGLSQGEAGWEIFRSRGGNRAAYCFRGAALDGSARAEHCANPGEILLDTAMHAALGDLAECEPVGDLFRLQAWNGRVRKRRAPRIGARISRHLRAFFPDSLVNLALHGEFRPLVTVFMGIPPEARADEPLRDFMRHVFDLQERYGGHFLRVDFGDKGCTLLMFWGAPVAHENDIQRALNFLVELRQASGVAFTAGVSYRMAYAGFVGAALREDYTGYGWGVSLAARMMEMAAPGEVWIDGELASRIAGTFELGPAEPRRFKGFATPQNIHRLGERRQAVEQIYRHPFEGRVHELGALERFLKPLTEGRFPGALVIRGEAGVGKSRLAHEFVRTRSDLRWAVFQADEILREAFNPFRYWLRRRFEIEPTLEDEQNLEHLLNGLDELAAGMEDTALREELVRTRSVIAALLNLPMPGSLYDQLDARGRYENTQQALAALLRAECARGPLALLIEDAHLLDDASRDFLVYLQRSLRSASTHTCPLAIVATARTEGDPFPAPAEAPAQELTLTGLDRAALERLAVGRLGGAVDPGLVNLLATRAEGNPFFAEQILRYALETGQVVLQAGTFRLAPGGQEGLTSTDIQSILIARLDRLTREVREVVQSAAVLGREFELRLLMRMLRDEDLADKVDEAEQADIWLRLDEISYIFRHALMRDAAYSMQLHARQQQLHALAVQAIETVHAGELDGHYAELAYHAERASLNDRALEYLKLAMTQARQTYQLPQALDFVWRALAIVPANEPRERFGLLIERATIDGWLGNLEARDEAIRAMDEIAAGLGEDCMRAQVELLRVRIAYAGGHWQEVIDLAGPAAALIEACGDESVMVDLYTNWTLALSRLGQREQAMLMSRTNLELARRLGQRREEAIILNGMGLVSNELIDRETARTCFEQALEISREIPDLYVEAQSLNNLGNLYALGGDYITTREYYQQALELTRRIGARSQLGLGLANLGWISALLGDLPAARDYQARALAISDELGNQYAREVILVNLSALAGFEGDAAQALEYGEQGLALARELKDPSNEAWAQLYLGFASLLAGDHALAGEAFQACIRLREELKQPSLRMEALAGLAETALAAGNSDEALSQVEQILAHFATGGTLDGVEEPLRVYLTCYRTLAAHGDPRAEQMVREGHAFLQESISGVKDEITRRMVIENVPWRRAIRDLWEGLSAD